MAGMHLSKNNPRLTQLRKLIKNPRKLREAGLCILETPKLVCDASERGIELDYVLAVSDVGALDVDADVFTVDDAVLASVVDARSSQGVLGVARRPEPAQLRSLTTGGNLLVAAGVQDPGNVGALIRVAAGAGMAGVLLDEQSADPWAPKALRGSAGTALWLPVRRTSTLADDLGALPRAGYTVAAAVAREGQDPYAEDLSGRMAFLLGGEGGGLSDELESRASVRLTIPMEGNVESLNVVVAGALLAFEAARQCAQHPAD